VVAAVFIMCHQSLTDITVFIVSVVHYHLQGRVVMGTQAVSPYQQVIEKTKNLAFRSQMLVMNIEKKLATKDQEVTSWLLYGASLKCLPCLPQPPIFSEYFVQQIGFSNELVHRQYVRILTELPNVIHISRSLLIMYTLSHKLPCNFDVSY